MALVDDVFDVVVPMVLVITITVVPLGGGPAVRDDIGVPDDSNGEQRIITI